MLFQNTRIIKYLRNNPKAALVVMVAPAALTFALLSTFNVDKTSKTILTILVAIPQLGIGYCITKEEK